MSASSFMDEPGQKVFDELDANDKCGLENTSCPIVLPNGQPFFLKYQWERIHPFEAIDDGCCKYYREFRQSALLRKYENSSSTMDAPVPPDMLTLPALSIDIEVFLPTPPLLHPSVDEVLAAHHSDRAKRMIVVGEANNRRQRPIINILEDNLAKELNVRTTIVWAIMKNLSLTDLCTGAVSVNRMKELLGSQSTQASIVIEILLALSKSCASENMGRYILSDLARSLLVEVAVDNSQESFSIEGACEELAMSLLDDCGLRLIGRSELLKLTQGLEGSEGTGLHRELAACIAERFFE